MFTISSVATRAFRASQLGLCSVALFLAASFQANATVISAGYDLRGSGLQGAIVDSSTITSVDKYGDAVPVITAFDEKQDVLIETDDILVNLLTTSVTAPFKAKGNRNFDEALPSGVTVDSHMIFLNQPREENGPLRFEMAFTFDGAVLGIMNHAKNLAWSDETFGLLDDILYPGQPGSPYKANYAKRGHGSADGDGDYVYYDPADPNTVIVSTKVTQPGDWIRIITLSPEEPPVVTPEPSTFALMLLGGAGLLAIRKRR